MSVTLLDRNGNPVVVDDAAEASSRFLRGELYARGRVPIMRDGQVTEVDATELDAALRGGASLATNELLRERTFGDQGEQAFVEGAMRGATLGLSDAAAGSQDPILRGAARLLPEAIAGDTGTLAYTRDEAAGAMLARQEENPIAAMGGEAVGVLGTLAAGPARALLPGGAALEAGLVAEGVGTAAAAAAPRATRVLRAGVGGATEGAISNLGIQAGQAGLRDEVFTGEAAAAAAGTGALLGFVGGTVVEGAITPIVGRVRSAFTRDAINRRLDELALGSLSPTPGDIAKLRGRSFDPEYVGRVIRDDPALLQGLRDPEEFLARSDEILGQEIGPEIEAILRQIDDEGLVERITPSQIRERIQREVLDENDIPFNESVFRVIQAKVDAALGPQRAERIGRALRGEGDEADAAIRFEDYLTPEELALYRVARENESAGIPSVDPSRTIPAVRSAAEREVGARDTLVGETFARSERRPTDTLPDQTMVERGPAFDRTELAPGRPREADRFDVETIRQLEARARARLPDGGPADRDALLAAMTDEERALYARARDRAGEFEVRQAELAAARAQDARATPPARGRRGEAESVRDTQVDPDLPRDMRGVARGEARRMRRLERLQREVAADAAARDTMLDAAARDTLPDPRAPRGPMGTRVDEPRPLADTIVDARGPRDTLVAENELFTPEAIARGEMRDARVRDAGNDIRADRAAAGDASRRASLYRGVREQLEQSARERAGVAREAFDGLGVLDLHAMRRAIDDDLYRGRVGKNEELTPQQQALKDVRDVINELLGRRVRSAADRSPEGSPLRAANERWVRANEKYQAVAIARDLARRAAAKEMAAGFNATPSLPLPMIALLTGNPGLAVMGWLAGMGKTWMRENGKAAAAIAGTRLARMMGLHLSANTMRSTLRAAAKAVISPAPRVRAAARIVGVDIFARDKFEDWFVEQQRNLPPDFEALDHTTDGAPTLGEIADVDVNAATAYAEGRVRAAQVVRAKLESKIREKGLDRSLQPQARKIGDTMSASERRELVDYVTAARSPLDALQSIRDGRVSFASVAGLRDAYPVLYAELVRGVAEELATTTEPLPPQQRFKLELLFPELPQNQHVGPTSVARWQERFLERDGGAAGGMISAGGGGRNQPPSLDDDQRTRAQEITE